MFNTAIDKSFVEDVNSLDPFSDDYKKICLSIYEKISNRSYQPFVGELMPEHSHIESNYPSPPFSSGSSINVGDYFMAWGGIIKLLNINSGMSVLELGAGDGHISLALARMQCDVHVLDAEPRYLNSIQENAAKFGVSVAVKHALFTDGFDGKKFDRILFFQSFHHELHHGDLLDTLRGMLNPGGFIVFSGEPIVERGNPFVPYCWGPRLDGLSVWCMRKWGWLELGFETGFFVELLMRHGFVVRRWMNPATGIGNCFIAEPNSSIVKLGECDIDIAIGDAGWHQAEGTHRWTGGQAFIPIDLAHSWRCAVLRGTNHLPMGKFVTFRCGSNVVEKPVPAGQTFELAVALVPDATRFEILCPLTEPGEIGNIDPRSLGIAIHEIEYYS